MLDGKNVSMSNPKSAVKVNDTSRLYKIKIEVSSSNDLKALDGLRLVAVDTDNQTSEAINAKNLSSQIKLKGANDDGSDSDDSTTSNQLLIHANAFNGFTLLPVQSGNILSLSWQDSDYANGSSKYFASSEEIKTTLGLASPWTDEEKIFGPALQAGISPDTDNPVVASYPIIKPLLEGFDLTDTKNISMSFTSDKTDTSNLSHSLSSTHEEGSSSSIGISANAGIDAKGPSGGLGFNYSTSWNTSDSSTNGLEYGTSNSLSVSEGIENNFNPSEKARMNIAMKFANYGTASLEGLNPMLSIAAGGAPDSMQTIVTINSTETRKIDRLNVGDVFPHGAPWLFSKIDSFDSTNIQITEAQYNALKNPANTVVVQLPQLSVSANNPVKWSEVLSRLPQVTAKFILRTPARDIERRVFAANPRDRYYYKQAELNLRDGLYTAFKLNALKNSQGVYTGQYTYNAEFNDYQQLNLANYVFESMNIITDSKTNNMINAQLSANHKVADNPLELLKLRPYMNFIVVPTGWVMNKFNNKKSYATLEHGFYRNEAALIGGSYYLFDAKGELVNHLGLQTIKQGKKVLTYDVNEKGMLNTGFKSDIGGMTPSDVALVKEFVELGIIKQSLENYCANPHEINTDEVLGTMLKSSPKIKGEYVKYYDVLNKFVANCTMIPDSIVGSPYPYCSRIPEGLTPQRILEYLNNKILDWDPAKYKYVIDETNARDYFVKNNAAVKELEVQINSTVNKLNTTVCNGANNKTYYFGPELKKGWIKDSDNFYYADAMGLIAKSQRNLIGHLNGVNLIKSDGLYYFNAAGVMQTNYFYNKADGIYYFDENGKAIREQEKIIDNTKYYFTSSGRAGKKPSRITYSLIDNSILKAIEKIGDKSEEHTYVLRNLNDAVRQTKDSISGVNSDPYAAVIGLRNSLTNANVRAIYRNSDVVGKNLLPASEDIIWNVQFSQGFHNTYTYNRPLVLSWPLNPSGEQCFVTLYTTKVGTMSHYNYNLVTLSLYAARAKFLPQVNDSIWQYLHTSSQIPAPGHYEQIKPVMYMTVKNNQDIYQIDLESNKDFTGVSNFNESGIDIGICSVS
jgi:glucan-binding YG repeat protein